jgi:hypothetical protein
MATEISRYMNPAADSGGDGSTNALSSGDNTHAYDSLDAALSGIETAWSNFVSSDVNVTLYCAGTVDSTNLSHSFTSVMDGTRYLTITAETDSEWNQTLGRIVPHDQERANIRRFDIR